MGDWRTLDEWSKYAERRAQNEGCLPRILQPETAFDAALLGHSLQIEKHPRFHLSHRVNDVHAAIFLHWWQFKKVCLFRQNNITYVVPTLVLSGSVKQIYSMNFFVCLKSQLRIDASEKLGTVVLSANHICHDMIFQWRLNNKSHGTLAHVIGLENLAAELSTQDQRWQIQIAYRMTAPIYCSIPVSFELNYGFLKITFHAVCNTALSEWKHFKSESAPCIKLLSLKRKSRLWIVETSHF